MPTENDVVSFLCDRMSLDEVERFLGQFGGYRIPKRSDLIERQRNLQILVACVLRTVNSKTVLSDEAARAVADEFKISAWAVKNRWYAWNRTGRPALESGATTDEGTTPETFRS